MWMNSTLFTVLVLILCVWLSMTASQRLFMLPIRFMIVLKGIAAILGPTWLKAPGWFWVASDGLEFLPAAHSTCVLLDLSQVSELASPSVAWSTVYAPWMVHSKWAWRCRCVKGIRMQGILDRDLPSCSLLHTFCEKTRTPGALAWSFRGEVAVENLAWRVWTIKKPILSWCCDSLPISIMPPGGCNM
jgi:hypothetical protein